MPTRRVYVDRRLADGGTVRLDHDTAHYVGRVLRCRPGDAVTLFNGDGREYPSRIERIDRSGVHVEVGNAVARDVESPLTVRLIQCISRGERMDTVVQKATELGVRRISPVESERSVVRLDAARADKRLAHWRRIGISACEQCGRNVPPVIDPPGTLAAALAGDDDAVKLMPEPGADALLAAASVPRAGIAFLIGPEGGLTAAERRQAERAGFAAVSLGPRTLRTETAAITALTLAQVLWGDLKPHPSEPANR